MSKSAPSSRPTPSASDRNAPSAADEGDAAPGGDDPLSCQPPDPPGWDEPAPTIQLVMETDDLDPPLAGWLEPRLRRLAQLAAVHRGELTVLAVDDAGMSEMHEQYTGVSGTTDVLTFDHADAPEPGYVEGDIAICLDEATRQARRRGYAPRLEALLYSLHGLLHLVGEDDHTEQAYERMHAREDELLKAIGLEALFATSEETEGGRPGTSERKKPEDGDEA